MRKRIVMLAVAVAGVFILPGTALAHHVDLHATYTCGTFAVDANFTGGGASGEPRRAVVKKDNVTVQTTDFTGTVNVANFYTDSGSLPAAHTYEVKLYRKDQQGNFTILDDTDTVSFNKQNTCSTSPTPTPTPTPTPSPTSTHTPTSGSGSTPTPTPVPPVINVKVVPDPLVVPDGPGLVTYTYTVTNEGTVAMDDVSITDNRCAGIAFVTGDTDGDSNLDTTEAWTYRCAATLSRTTTSTITVSDETNGFTTTDTATVTVLVDAAVPPPLIQVVVRPDVFVLPPGGGAVTYTYIVTNPGTEPLSDVTVTDPTCTGVLGPVAGNPGDTNGNGLLESNESWMFTCRTVITRTTTTSTVMASGDANSLTATDTAIVTVLVAGLIDPGFPSAGLPPESGIPWALVIAGAFVITAGTIVVRLRKSSI